jgi:hypothetical protein
MCGQLLTYVRSDGEWHFYRCPTHQTVVLPPNGRMKVDDSEDSDVRH